MLERIVRWFATPILALATIAAAPPIDAGTTAKIDAIAKAAVSAQHLPSLALGISFRGHTVYAHGYGYRDVANSSVPDASTWYSIGSITKQFTASLVMRQVQAGRIALDVPVGRYVSDAPHGDEITVRQLLNHVSGLEDYTNHGIASLATPGWSPERVLAPIAAAPLEFAPGSDFEYSNSNYILLGALLERVAKTSYTAQLTAMLNEAHVAGVRFGPPPPGDVAVGYSLGTSGPVSVAKTDDTFAGAAGGIWATVDGLLAWEHALFSGRVVTPASLAEMTRSGSTPATGPTDYGFGLDIGVAAGRRFVSHDGGITGFAAVETVFPERGWTIVALTNTESGNLEAPTAGIMQLLDPPTATERAAAPPPTPAVHDDPAVRALLISLIDDVRASGSLECARMAPNFCAQIPPDAMPSLETLKSLPPRGAVTAIARVRRGGNLVYVYDVAFGAARQRFRIGFRGAEKKPSIFAIRPAPPPSP